MLAVILFGFLLGPAQPWQWCHVTDPNYGTTAWEVACVGRTELPPFHTQLFHAQPDRPNLCRGHGLGWKICRTRK